MSITCTKSFTINGCPKCTADAFLKDSSSHEHVVYSVTLHPDYNKLVNSSSDTLAGGVGPAIWNIIPTCTVTDDFPMAAAGTYLTVGSYVPTYDTIWVGCTDGLLPINVVTDLPDAVIPLGTGTAVYTLFVSERDRLYSTFLQTGPNQWQLYEINPADSTTSQLFTTGTFINLSQIAYSAVTDQIFGTDATAPTGGFWCWDFATSTRFVYYYTPYNAKWLFYGICYDPGRQVIYAAATVFVAGPVFPPPGTYPTGYEMVVIDVSSLVQAAGPNVIDLTTLPQPILHYPLVSTNPQHMVYDADLDRVIWANGNSLWTWDPNTQVETEIPDAAYSYDTNSVPAKRCQQYYWPAYNAAFTEAGVRVHDETIFTP